MLFSATRRKIAELEAEVRSLQEKLSDADELIAEQRSELAKLREILDECKCDPRRDLNAKREWEPQQKPKAQNDEARGLTDEGKSDDEVQGNDGQLDQKGKKRRNLRAKDHAKNGGELTLSFVKAALKDHIKQDLQNRWVRTDSIETARLNTPMSNEALEARLLAIFKKGGRKRGINKRWEKLNENCSAREKLVALLPFIFDMLLTEYCRGNHWNNKNPQLVYNARSYLLLVNELIPGFANEARHKREDAQRKMQKKRQLEAQRKIEERRERDRQRRERERRAQGVHRKLEAQRKLEEQRKQERERQLQREWPLFVQELEAQLAKHSVAFLRNMRAAYQKDDYGAIIKDDCRAEIERFLSSINLLRKATEHGLDKTVVFVLRWYTVQQRAFEQADKVPDNGHDFEHWVAAKLKAAGWTASVTQASGDDGVDVIAEQGGLRVAVQCKRFKGSVGNKAVQEVYSGMKHMQLERAVVISTGKYTKAAQDLASTTGVLLLSEHDIPHLWDLLQH